MILSTVRRVAMASVTRSRCLKYSFHGADARSHLPGDLHPTEAVCSQFGDLITAEDGARTANGIWSKYSCGAAVVPE
jgi:hypothetical protein